MDRAWTRGPARNINRMFILQARAATGRRNVAAIGTDAPARCPFSLLLSLWASKEKVDSKRQIEVQTFERRVDRRKIFHVFKCRGYVRGNLFVIRKKIDGAELLRPPKNFSRVQMSRIRARQFVRDSQKN